MDKPKTGAVPVAVFAVGIIGLAHLTREPRFNEIRDVDFFQILGSGMCFGVGLMALIQKFRKPRQ
jgi:hypothetical protein